MSHKGYDNNLVTICKSRLALKLNKPAYNGMCVLELRKILMYKFHCDYIKNKYDDNSKLLFTDTDSLIYEIKTEDVYEDFSNDKELFDVSNYLPESKFYDTSHKLAIGKMKDETGSAAIKEFVELKPKMCSLLVDNREHKKAKGVNRNAVATISHNEYKDVLLNNKCKRQSMNRIQSKEHKIGTNEINKVSLSRFDGKIYIQNYVYEGLTVVIRVNYKKNSDLSDYFEKKFLSSIFILIFSLVRTAFLSSILNLKNAKHLKKR